MTHREEEILILLAFGEADENEKREAEALVANSPEAATFLAEMRSLNGTMPSLREISECQLTTERMRDAILSDATVSAGKSRKQKVAWLNWGLAAACLAAVSFAISMNGNRSAAPVVAENEPAVTSDVSLDEAMATNDTPTSSSAVRKYAAKLKDTKPLIVDTTSTVAPEQTREALTQVVNRPVRRSNKSLASRKPAAQKPSTEQVASMISLGTAGAVSNTVASNTGNRGHEEGAGGGAAMSMQATPNADVSAKAKEADAVVVVETSRGADGANRAKEVNQSELRLSG
ncbi:MAG: hypothetical protein KDC26_07725 [Armatimonadetes bacterium]|nr:hypothetical protein [Armatimonadota bacterium]